MLPFKCAKKEILRASKNQKFKSCVSNIYPMFYGYLTALLIPQKCTDPIVLLANHEQLNDCLNDELSKGDYKKGSIGLSISVMDCAQKQESLKKINSFTNHLAP